MEWFILLHLQLIDDTYTFINKIIMKNKNNRYFAILAFVAMVISSTIIYLTGSLCNANFDIRNWEGVSRTVTSMLFFVCQIIITIITISIYLQQHGDN